MATILLLGWAGSIHIHRWVDALAERGHALTLVSYGASGAASGSAYAAPENVNTIILPKTRLGKLSYLFYARRIREIARSLRPAPDIIHAHYASSYGLWGLCAKSALTNTPLIVSVWGSDVTRAGKGVVTGAVVRQVLRKASRVTASSNYLRDQVARMVSNVSPVVVPFGVAMAEVERVLEAPPDRADSEVRFLFLKALQPVYGPEILLEAFANLRREEPNVRLTMAGEGTLREKSECLAKRLGIEKDVTFPGYIESTRLFRFIREHDALVMPTRIPEGFGVVALEAAALGLPVIATHPGGVTDIVESGVTGLLVPPNDLAALTDAMRTLARDKGLRQRLGAQAMLRAKHFAWTKCVDEMGRVYRSTLL